MRLRTAGLLVLLVALGLLGALIAITETAEAVGQRVEVPDNADVVVEGDSVPLNVTFGPESNQVRVRVSCPSLCQEAFERTVTFDDDKRNCRFENGRPICRISFPGRFEGVNTGLRASTLGQPAHRAVYNVEIVDPVNNPPGDTFSSHMSSPFVCRDGDAWRSDVLLFSSSGHPEGETFTFTVRDQARGITVLEETRVSAGSQIPYHFLWEVPLDYDLGGDGVQQFKAEVEKNGRTESETFSMFPASPEWRIAREPGFNDDPIHYNRTQKTHYWIQPLFLAAPRDCDLVSPLRRVVQVTQDDITTGMLEGRVDRYDTAGGIEETEIDTVANLRATFVPGPNLFLLNWTIPRDAEATREGALGVPGSPEYTFQILEHELEDGNLIRPFRSEFFRVHPYDIEPRIEVLPEEVERLETAEVVFNITYADGSAFTPNDTSEDLVVELKHEEDDQPLQSFTLNHRNASYWNASLAIGIHHEPLGEYRWILRSSEDRHGERDMHNQLRRTTTQVFEIVGAKPVIEMDTFVGSEPVNGTERTRTVHVSLTAIYKDGRPLTEDNVDPSLGGVQLNVKKTNAFGRVLDVDQLIMTDADGEGTWVRSFRVARTADQAPVGTWELEVLAGDDREPTNRNETSFPFEVEPAHVVVSPLKEPPDMVEDEQVEFRVRLTYPDGSLFTEEMADPNRGGEVTFKLERVSFLNQTETTVELRPRSVQGGQEWQVSLDPSTLVPGPHFFNVTGTDIHGNIVGPYDGRLFTVLFNGEFRNSTTPICPGGGKIDPQGDPQCALPRGSEVFALYPKSQGDKGYFAEEPQVSVLRQLGDEDRWVLHRQDVTIGEDRFFELTGREAGENHVGYFQSDASTPTGKYILFIIGRGEDDRGFAGYSVKFEITAIEVEREIIDALPSFAQKGERLSALVQNEPGDVIDDVMVRAGSVTFQNVRATPTAVGTFVQWTPSRTAPSGPATIELQGRDLFGNRFDVRLGPVELEPAQIRVEVEQPPPIQAPREANVRLEAKLFFPDSLPYTPNHGNPEVLVLDVQGNQVDTGEARYFSGRWFFDWTPPFDTEPGKYHFQVTGRDRAGNLVGPFESRTFEVVPGKVDASFPRNPQDIRRGQVAQATLRFPADVANVSAVVSTGTSELGSAQMQVDGREVRLAFPTDRTTELVLARFEVTGLDEHGNELDAETRLFRISPQQMRVNILRQPQDFVQKGETVIVDFVIEYPDGTRLRPGLGTPVVGLFARDTPLGPVKANPREQNPTVWRISWEPREDISKEVPYRFAISGLDRWENTVQPASSNGFFIQNPVVPDYLPVPSVHPLLLLITAGVGAHLLALRRRGDLPGEPPGRGGSGEP